MLQIRNLTITYQKDLRVLIDDFSYTLNRGDRTVVIGEEGNGKSTLLKWIYDPSLISGYADAEGTRTMPGEVLGYLSQELEEKDRDKTIFEFLSEEERFFELTAHEITEISRQTGIPSERFWSDQKMNTLSGGEKVKIRMARILASAATILLLDEPTNDLDIETLEWMERWLNETDKGVMYVSHDETFIERTATRIIHMELLRRKQSSRITAVSLPYREYIDRRLADEEHQRQMAVSERKEDAARMERFRRIHDRVEHEQATISRQDPAGGRLLKKKMHAVKSMEKRFEKQRENMTEMPVKEEAIFFDFPAGCEIPSGKMILDLHLQELCAPDGTRLSGPIDLSVFGGAHVCIFGRNGTGKTTLLKKIRDILQMREDIRMAYMPQNYEDLLDLSRTPIEFLAPSGSREDVTRARSYLGSMRYTTDEMTHACSDLSGGQKAKVLLLKMILDESNVLILDEPTRNFSPLSSPVIRSVLRSFRGAVIAVSHDRKYIAEAADTVYSMDAEGLHRQ
ncbi:MAG: ABC-F family ATP-binding cassette domain-containing protein [Solobacterium sp.]|nr:ABC-F family ATP-binding cassette domain-containing protein [Solobacterium sp.]